MRTFLVTTLVTTIIVLGLIFAPESGAKGHHYTCTITQPDSTTLVFTGTGFTPGTPYQLLWTWPLQGANSSVQVVDMSGDLSSQLQNLQPLTTYTMTIYSYGGHIQGPITSCSYTSS